MEACCWIDELAVTGPWAAWAGWVDGDVFEGFGDGLDDDDDAFDAALCARNATNRFARKGLLVGISIVAMNRPLMRQVQVSCCPNVCEGWRMWGSERGGIVDGRDRRLWRERIGLSVANQAIILGG